MSSVIVKNLKNPEIGVTSVKCRNSETKTLNKDKISEFFERHVIIRNIALYLPTIVIGGVVIIEKTTSHKLLSEIGIVLGIALTTMWCFFSLAQSCERSLKNKTIEHLNAGCSNQPSKKRSSV